LALNRLGSKDCNGLFPAIPPHSAEKHEFLFDPILVTIPVPVTAHAIRLTLLDDRAANTTTASYSSDEADPAFLV
jgi:hypothetical protein